MSAAGTLIQHAVAARKAGDSVEFARAVETLYKQVPARWLELLLLSDALPDPSPGLDLMAETEFLLGALEVLRDSGIDLASQLKLIAIGLGTHALSQYYREVLRVRNRYKFFGLTPASQIWAWMRFIESQVGLSREVSSSQSPNGLLLPDSSVRASVAQRFGSSVRGVAEAVEGMGETVELAVRECLWRAKNEGFGGIDEDVAVYENPEFEAAGHLAGSWALLRELWGRVRYLGWAVLQKDDGSSFFAPSRRGRFEQGAVGTYRHGLFLAEIGTAAYSFAASAPVSDTTPRIEALARSVSIPSGLTEAWDGVLDEKLLAQATARTSWEVVGEFFLDLFGYEPLLRRVRIPSELAEPLGWEDWMGGFSCLQVIGQVLHLALSRAPRPLVVESKTLAGLLESSTRVRAGIGEALVSGFCLDPSQKRTEIWDSPLVRISDSRLVLAPNLISIISPQRAVENVIHQYGSADDFSLAGPPFEAQVSSIWSSVPDARVVSGRRVVLPRGLAETLGRESLEFDLVAYWDGHLFFFEAKWLKSIHSAADEYRGWKSIEKALGQLRLRQAIAWDNWQWFRKAFPGLGLPDKKVRKRCWHSVAITNVLHFTPWRDDRGLVTDAMVLERYFETPEVEALVTSSEGVSSAGVVGRIRRGPPTPRGLMEYLSAPPQVERVRRGIRHQPTRLLVLEKDGQRLGYLDTHFEGLDISEYEVEMEREAEVKRRRRARIRRAEKRRRKHKGK